jgi:hypothetical protein
MAVVVPVISTFDNRGIKKAIADFKLLDKAGQRGAFTLLNTNKAVNSLGMSFAKFGVVAGGAAAIIGGKFAQAAYESQKVMKQTEAIIAATGGAAGMTANQVADLSEKFSLQTGIDDELIQTSLNLLLTFKKIRNEVGEGNDIFNRAGQAALDLGNVFGSVDAAAIQLGKALSDPTRGITALRKSGIDFTQQQQDQIKTLVQSGNILEAQKIILGEVEAQVGGTAEATATGFDKMRVAIGNAEEKLGTALIPYIERFADIITNNVVPVISHFAEMIGEQGAGAAIQYLNGSIINGLMSMGMLGKTVLLVGSGFVALKVAVMTYTAVQGALTLAANLTTNALRQQAIQANATKIALLAAGGVTALLSIAATVYGVYASKKAQATQATQDFVSALELEGDAQSKALADLYKTNPAFRNAIDTVNQYGQSVDTLKEYVLNNKGAMTEWAAVVDSVAVDVERLDEITTNANPNIDTQATAYDRLRQRIPALVNATKEQIDTFITSIKLFQTMRRETQSTADALAIFGGTAGGASTATGGLGRSVETASDKFKKFKDQAKTVADATRSVRDATKSTADAQKELQKTTDAVAVAQEKLNKIASGYGADSKEGVDAQKELTDANRAATRAQFDLEKANFAVTDAERNLREARRTGTPREIREAEIALEEARIAQVEAQENLTAATNAVTAAQTRLNETINGASTDSQTYKDALAELQTAQDAQKDAIDRVRSAKERELDVTRNLVKAEILLKKARGTLTKEQLKKANKILKDLNKPVNVTIPVASVSPATATASGVVPLAQGGIVTRPTLSLIGEGGEPEAVIPLSKMRDTMSGGITVNIQTGVGDPVEIGRQVVTALQAYQRRSGSLPLKVG